ncbi:MAG: hypothetical protein N2596_09125, partial [Syntrophorhabdaceae bacterium]|nr:hypothetical protein [Syntrophorhabdaceae bacterium]
MIEILHPGLLAIIVDKGRYGFSHIGVPLSSCLDDFAYEALKYLIDTHENPPVIEIIGSGFSLKFHSEISCAITGARVEASLDNEICHAWKTFQAKKGSVLRIKSVKEGFRYYIGFSG